MQEQDRCVLHATSDPPGAPIKRTLQPSFKASCDSVHWSFTELALHRQRLGAYSCHLSGWQAQRFDSPAAVAPAGAVWSVHAGRCPGGGVFVAYGCEDGLVCTLEAAVPRDTRLQQPAPTAACGADPHLGCIPTHGNYGPFS